MIPLTYYEVIGTMEYLPDLFFAATIVKSLLSDAPGTTLSYSQPDEKKVDRIRQMAAEMNINERVFLFVNNSLPSEAVFVNPERNQAAIFIKRDTIDHAILHELAHLKLKHLRDGGVWSRLENFWTQCSIVTGLLTSSHWTLYLLAYVGYLSLYYYNRYRSRQKEREADLLAASYSSVRQLTQAVALFKRANSTQYRWSSRHPSDTERMAYLKALRHEKKRMIELI